MRLLQFYSCSIATMTHGVLDEFSLPFTSVYPSKRWESTGISNGARKDSFHVSPARYSITIPSFDIIKSTLFKASLNTTKINKSFGEYIKVNK